MPKYIPPPTKFSPVTHAIFDLDGLILDTETLDMDVYKEISSIVAKTEFPPQVKQKMLGMKERDAAEIFVEELQLSVGVDEIRNMRQKLCKERMGKIKLLPGIEKLITHLKNYNIPMALAANIHYDSFEPKFVSHKQIFESFSEIVSGIDDPDVKRRIPKPDMFLVTAKRLPDKPKPKKCLVFQKSPNGVKAAIAAGMQVVMIPNARVHPRDTRKATLVLRSMCEFRPECFCLPPFP